MIRKFLLIGESGLLLYYLNQDEAEIDNDLLSGFCQAIYNISLELKYPLKNIGFENHKMIVECVDYRNEKKLLLVALYDDYHIDEAIKNKLYHIYKDVFEKMNLQNENRRLNFEEINIKVKKILNDEPLRDFVLEHQHIINDILEPILREKDNNIVAYALTSSNNTLLCFNGSLDLIMFRAEDTVEDIIKNYLRIFALETIPQGDKFIGSDLPNGLDPNDYYITEEKTYGIVINTCINLKEEPNNELLLYLFGKNMLIRSIVPNIEEKLRLKLIGI
ncbi:MAG: hypothetical protein ACP6IY_07370 [Promethearchaeia archaeon]